MQNCDPQSVRFRGARATRWGVGILIAPCQTERYHGIGRKRSCSPKKQDRVGALGNAWESVLRHPRVGKWTNGSHGFHTACCQELRGLLIRTLVRHWSASETPVTIRRLKTREVYRNPWMAVREDEIERNNGTRGIYGVVEKSDSAIIVPIEGSDVILVEQFRYPISEQSVEFPQGSLENNSLEPLEIARRELREETGIDAGSFEYLGEIIIAIGYSGQKTHAFVARELMHGPSAPDLEEHDLKILRVSIPELERLILENKIKDAQTLAAWALYKTKVGAGGTPFNP